MINHVLWQCFKTGFLEEMTSRSDTHKETEMSWQKSEMSEYRGVELRSC